MSAPLSRLYAEAASKTNSCAAIYPDQIEMLKQDDFMPGSYGTYKDGIWQKLGDIKDFGARYEIPPSGVVTGQYTWGSEKLKTTSVVFQGGAWVVGEDGAGDAQLGVQFTDSTDTLFYAASGNPTQYEIDPTVLDTIVAAVQNRKDSGGLRFITAMVAVDAVLAFGGTAKRAACVVSGAAQALTDLGTGRVTGQLQISESNVSELKANFSPGNQLLPFAMYLYEINKHGKQMNNDPA